MRVLSHFSNNNKNTKMIADVSRESERTSSVDKLTPTLKSYTKKGILMKKGMGKLFRPWTLRTVYVDVNQMLSYYDERQTLKGELNLEGANIRYLTSEEADGRDNAIEISNISGIMMKNNILVLACGSLTEANDWFDCLTAAANSTIRSRTADDRAGYATLEEELKKSQESDVADIQTHVQKLKAKAQQKKMQQQQRKESFEVRSVFLCICSFPWKNSWYSFLAIVLFVCRHQTLAIGSLLHKPLPVY